MKNLSSQLTHCELTWKSQKSFLAWVTVSSFWGHLSSSQCTHKMSSQWACHELSVSLQLSQLANCYHCMVCLQMTSKISHSKLMMWVANSQKAHNRLTVGIILQILCEATECTDNELKFFTGVAVLVEKIINWFSATTHVIVVGHKSKTKLY